MNRTHFHNTLFRFQSGLRKEKLIQFFVLFDRNSFLRCLGIFIMAYSGCLPSFSFYLIWILLKCWFCPWFNIKTKYWQLTQKKEILFQPTKLSYITPFSPAKSSSLIFLVKRIFLQAPDHRLPWSRFHRHTHFSLFLIPFYSMQYFLSFLCNSNELKYSGEKNESKTLLKLSNNNNQSFWLRSGIFQMTEKDAACKTFVPYDWLRKYLQRKNRLPPHLHSREKVTFCYVDFF